MIKVSQLVDSQLSDFFRQEYPTFIKFFEEYYKATEIDGASTGILRKIQNYQNADFYKDGILLETTLDQDVIGEVLSCDINTSTPVAIAGSNTVTIGPEAAKKWSKRDINGNCKLKVGAKVSIANNGLSLTLGNATTYTTNDDYSTIVSVGNPDSGDYTITLADNFGGSGYNDPSKSFQLNIEDTVIHISQKTDNKSRPIWKRFPDEGIVLLDNGVNQEIVQYKGVDSGTGFLYYIQRGASGSIKLGDLLDDSTFLNTTSSSFNADTITQDNIDAGTEVFWQQEITETTVTNISHLFLATLFKNLKSQYFSGIPIERLNQDISVPTILKYIKDFYSSKGTSPAIEFLFRTAFSDEKIRVRYPNEQLLKSSESSWSIDTVLQTTLVEFGDGITVDDLPGRVLKQIKYGYDDSIGEATARIEKVIPITSGNDILYRIYLNPNSIIGTFNPANETILTSTFGNQDKTVIVDSTVGFPEINGEFYVDGVVDEDGKQVIFQYGERNATGFYDVNTSWAGWYAAAAGTGPAPNTALFGSNVLYVVDDVVTNPIREGFAATFRSAGLISDIDVRGSGLFVKEGDVVEFGLSGKKPDSPINTSWRQNVPQSNLGIGLADAAGNMVDKYLTGEYKVAYGVSQVFEDDKHVYVSSNGFPETPGSIGEIGGGDYALLEPASQRHLKKIPKTPIFGEIKTRLPDNATVGISVDGVPFVSPTGVTTFAGKSEVVSTGDLKNITVLHSGTGYTSAPKVIIDGTGGATAVATISGGKVTGINITQTGGYTSTPDVTITSGINCDMTATFDSGDLIGVIDDLVISNSGQYYTQLPEIVIVDESGRGRGAKFVVSTIDPLSGGITSITKISGGFDYDKTKTKVYVVPTSSGATAVAEITQWHRDNINYFQPVADLAGGYPFPGILPEYNDAYYYVGNPVGIRKTLSDNISGGSARGDDAETAASAHSPILGWSYDGVPIYGPVGYEDPLDMTSGLKRVESSYFLKGPQPSDRGGLSVPTVEMGTFVEDYVYKAEGDINHKDLDEFNGRFCKTPEFPEGRYCYFTTIHTTSDTNQKDPGKRLPRYPYMIGPSYKYSPETTNFTAESILKNLPESVIRVRDANDTIPQYGSIVNATVSNVSTGSVNSTIIENGGKNYFMNTVTGKKWKDGDDPTTKEAVNPKWGAGDHFYVDNENTDGAGFTAEVASIIPKSPTGEEVTVNNITASDIIGKIDSREQLLVLPAPSYNSTTKVLTYNRINEGDIIEDNSVPVYTFRTALPMIGSDTKILLRTQNTSNIVTGMTLEVGEETLYVSGASTNSLKYVYLTMGAVQSSDPVGTETSNGFFYSYLNGSIQQDYIWKDNGDHSDKIGKILGIDKDKKALKIEMLPNEFTRVYAPESLKIAQFEYGKYTDPETNEIDYSVVQIKWIAGVNNTNVIGGGLVADREIKLSGFSEEKLNGTWKIKSGFATTGAGNDVCYFQIDPNNTLSAVPLVFNNTNTPDAIVELANTPGLLYTIPTSGGLGNRHQDNARYQGNVQSVEYVKEFPVIRGYDGTTAIYHKSEIDVLNQRAKGELSDYRVRLYVTSGTMDAFTVGVSVKGQNSDCTAEIVKIEPQSTTAGYLWVKNIKEGADASDQPRFGIFDEPSGTWSTETITEIGSGNVTSTLELIGADTTVIKVANATMFPINRYISIGTETMRIVGKSGNNLTVAREQLDTVKPTSGHLIGSTVAVVNASATFDTDVYYATVKLSNHQRFSTSSTFADNDDNNISVTSATINPLSATASSLVLGPDNYDFFKLDHIVKIDNELIRLNTKNTNVFSITRGYNNTTPASHTDQSSVINQSDIRATLTTDITHSLIYDDMIEITGDTSVAKPGVQLEPTLIKVKFDGTANRFLFSSVHTGGTSSTDVYLPNPDLDFVYGHSYEFDVSHLSNQTTILAFWLDDLYTNSQAADAITGVPGQAGAKIILQITDKSIVNVFYNNANSLITDSAPRLKFIEDPYNVGGASIFNVHDKSFDFIINSRVEGPARGTKRIGVVSPNAFGEISRVAVTNQGFAYESLPEIKGLYLRKSDSLRYQITIDDNDGSISGVSILYGGSRYINPTVYVTGTGTGARLVTDTNGGSVRSVSVASSGSGYGPGTELVLVEEDDNNVRVLPSSSTIGRVLGLSITNPGSRFSNDFSMAPETKVPVSMQVIFDEDYKGSKIFEYGEQVYQGTVNNKSVVGTVVDYNSVNQTLRVSGVVGTFEVGKQVTGRLTGAEATPSTVNTPDITSIISAVTNISGFFSDDLGKLSTSSQKIQDSYFYQDFSYVIRSQIPVSDWREIIKDSTHPAGFLVFGEVIVDSSASVTTVPLGGGTTCPPNKHRFTFNTQTEVSSTGEIFINGGKDIEVGDSFRYYQSSDYEVKWTAINAAGENIDNNGLGNKLVVGKIYYVIDTTPDYMGTDGIWITISDQHPNDTFADAAHSKERLSYKVLPTSLPYYSEIICDPQNPQKVITIEIFKQFIDIDPLIPMKLAPGGRITTVQINKFFRMVERPGVGSLISAEGTVAIDLAYVDDITANIDGIKKIFDVRKEGSLFPPYSENSFLVSLDGVTQEPGVAYTLINDRKIQSLEVTTTGAGPLEYDSWKITSGTTDIDNGTTVVSGTADVSQVYKDKEFIYISSKGVPSYTSTIGPYSGLNPSFQDYIKRIPTKVFAPIDKEDTPLGLIGIFVNGTILQNPKLTKNDATIFSYKGDGTWIINEPGSNPSTDDFGGKSNSVGNYYQAANPIGLRRQLKDNMTETGDYKENSTDALHSPILAWAFDGTPIYGPYGYSVATSAVSAIKKIESGYSERPISVRNVLSTGEIVSGSRVGPPVNSIEFEVLNWVSFQNSTDTFVNSQVAVQTTSDSDDTPIAGMNGIVEDYDPINRRLLLSSVNGNFSQNMWIKTQTAWAQIVTTPIIYKIGYFTEDYIYNASTGDLDEYNGRFCVTPEFPEGRYCYFMTIKNSVYDYSALGNTSQTNAAYPYAVGPKLYHRFYQENQLSKSQLGSKIVFNSPPTKYFDPSTGHEQVQQFIGRTFGFSDTLNNQNYSKKYVDISPQFDGYKTTFALQYTSQQASYQPNDPVEPSESALVFLDGIIQIPGSDNSYTVDDVNNTITFSSPPKRIGKIINMSEVSEVLKYEDNEVITGVTSGATGKIIARTALGYEGKGVLKVEVLTKDFVDGENVTGETSNKTAPIKLVGTVTAKDRFLDAANLLEANKDLIAEEAVLTMLDYPGYKVPNLFKINSGVGNFTNQDCIDDVKDVISAIVDNIRYGGNDKVWEAADLYVNGGALQHLVGEEEPSKLAFRWAKDLCVLAMQNKLNDYNTLGTSTGYSTYDNASTNKSIDGANLIEWNKDFIANEAVDRMLAYPGNNGFSVPYHKSYCVDDVRDALDCMIFNLTYGGNNKTWDAANFFATGRHIVDGMSGPSNKFTPTGATYDPATGNLVLTVGDHDLVVGSKVKIADGGLTFNCTMDGNSSNKTYPRQVDPYYRRAIDVTAVGSTDHTIESGTSYNPSTGVLTAKITGHNFKGRTSHTATTGTVYNPTTGILTVTTTSDHYLVNGDKVVIADNSLTFTCTHGTGNHTYPRNTDPVSGKWLTVSNVTANTFQVQVLFTVPSTNTTTHTFVPGLTAAIDGISKIGDRVLISDESLTFTCAKDAHQTNHLYPRSTDPWSGKWLEIYNQTTDTFDVQVGISSNTSTHIFDSAIAGGLKKQDGTITLNVGSTAISNYTPTAGSYEPTTGVLSLTIGNHSIRQGDSIKIATDSISFDCGAGAGTKTYPRANGTGGATADDPAYNTAVEITSVGYTEHTVGSGTSYNAATGVMTVKPSGFDVTDADYNTTTGDLVLTIGNHSLTTSDSIRILENGLTFQCPAATGTHIYDGGTAVGAVTINGSDVKDVTDASYNPTTGLLTMNIGNHSYNTTDNVRIGANAISFTCDADNHGSSHTYPRTTDPAYNVAINISSVTIDTITVSVGVASATQQSSYPRSTGAATGNGADYAYNTSLPITAADATTITINVNGGQGAISIGSTHTFVSALSQAIKPIIFADNDRVKFVDNSLTFTCNKDNNATNHTYPRVTDPKTGQWLPISNVSLSPTGQSFDVQVGIGSYTEAHTFVSGTTNGLQRQDGTITMNVGTSSNTTAHTYVTAAADAIIAGGNYTHTFVSASTDSLITGGEQKQIIQAFESAKEVASDVIRNTLVDIKGSHGLTQHTNATITDSSFTLHTPTQALYNPTSGEMVLTIANHGLTTGNTIEIDTDSLEFTCSMDSNASKHTYPRSTDPSNRKVLEIIDYTTDTIILNVGSTTSESYNVTDVYYNETNGDMELTIGDHNLLEGQTVKLDERSLTFTCSKDFNVTQHSYPRPPNYVNTQGVVETITGDPYYNKPIPIKSVGVTPYTITDAKYDPESGIATLTVPNIGGGSILSQPSLHKATSASYNALTGELTIFVTGETFEQGDMVRIAPHSMFFSCTMDGGLSKHSYPRLSDPASNKWLPVASASSGSFTVNVGVSPIVGYSISDSNYDPATGNLTLTVGDHNLDIGTSIRISKDSLTFTCEMDQNGSNHTYPRTTDPFYNKSVSIVSKTKNSITVNVGTTPIVTHNVTDANYNTATGDLVLTIGSHSITQGESIKIATGSLKFECGSGQQDYPRASGANTTDGKDYAYDTAVTVLYSDQSGGTITVNVNQDQNIAISNSDTHQFISATPSAISSGGNYPHTFVSTSNTYTPTSASYNPTTGFMTINITDHKFGDGDYIRIADGGISFTCTHGTGVKAYPRTTDPASGNWLKVSNVTPNTFDVQVLENTPSTNVTPHTFSSAVSNCIERAVFVTGGNYAHTFVDSLPDGIEKATKYIQLIDESISFTCGLDNHSTVHDYPRSSDPFSGRWLPVSSIDGDTFDIQIGSSPNKSDHIYFNSSSAGCLVPNGKITINVGVASLPPDRYSHTFVSATLGCLKTGGEYAHTFSSAKTNCITARKPLPKLQPTGATYDPTTGDLLLTVKGHGLTTSDRISIAPNSMNFTCSMDDNSTEHSYPRKSDPVASSVIPVKTINTTDTFTVNVGTTSTVSHNVSNATYSETTGDMLLTIGNHDLKVGTSIKLADNSLTFKCQKDNYQTTHSYPRTDIINKDIDICQFNAVTGILSITSADHGFSNGDTVKIADNSIHMTCTMDGNTATKSYPRATDPISGKWMTVSNAQTDTFDIHVGKSPKVEYTPSVGTEYNPSTGLLKLHIGPHNLKVGDPIRFKPDSLVFRCALDFSATLHAYPRQSDPMYNTAVDILSKTDDTITVQVLTTIPSTNTSGHTFISATKGAVISGGDYPHTFVSANAGAISHKKDKAYDTSITIIEDGSSHTITGADYNPITGKMVVTINNHLFNNGDKVRFVESRLAFKCKFDDDATVHMYPRPNDPAAGKWLTISNKTDNTFEVNVGKSSNTSKHTFDSASTIADGLVRNNGQIKINVGYDLDTSNQFPHTFDSATAGAVISGGNYTHSFVSAFSNAITVLDYDRNDCADVISAVSVLSGIITGAVADPKSIRNIVRTTHNAHPIVHSTRTLVEDNAITIDPASRNYTASCADVASSISTLMNIIINTIDKPSSLANVPKTLRRTFVEKEGIYQKFFAYSNGKYTVLDSTEITSPQTTFVMSSNGSLVIPNSSEQIIVIVNGVVQEYSKSYVINESLVEFYKPVLPDSDLKIYYWYGRDLQKILKGYNVPLYEPSYIYRDGQTGVPILHVTESGVQTNKRIRTLPVGAYPIFEFFRKNDEIIIDGEDKTKPRQLLDLSNRDIIEWEKLIESNIYQLNAATDIVGIPAELRFERYGNQSTSGFISGTKIKYNADGNTEISGLTDGTTYYLGYNYTTKGVRLYTSYLNSVGGGTNPIVISAGTGIHKFEVETDLSGLKQTQFKTSDYAGTVRGREATFTGRVRFTMTLSDSTAYTTPGTIIFSAGMSAAVVVEDLGSNKIVVQIYPDRVLADGAALATDLGGSNPVTMTSKENGYIHAIESLSGSFPTGLDYDTAPILVIKPAATDTGVFARAHAEIDENKQIARCVVDYEGKDYFQVPEILVTRAYTHITQTYPLALVRNQYNFWSSFDTTLRTTMVLDAKQLTVSFDNTVTTQPVQKAGQEVTIFRKDEMLDGLSEDVSKVYDYTNPTDSAFPIESASDLPNITSIGRLRLSPTFQSLEENKFNVDSTLTLGSLDNKFGGLRIKDVSDRFYSSVYDDANVAGVQTIRFDATSCTMVREFAGKIAANVNIGDTYIPLEGVYGFNFMIVEGNTFWLDEDMPIYEERTFVEIGKVDKIVDSNTFIIKMNLGQNLLSGTNISNVQNTVMVSIASQVYGQLETGKERLAYKSINWNSKWLMLTQPCTKSYNAGEFVRTARPLRLGST